MDQTVFDDSAPWGTLEECFTLVRSGSELRDWVSEGSPVAIMNPAVQLQDRQQRAQALQPVPRTTQKPLGIDCILQLMRRDDLVDPDD
jgi:hypothetical protein